MLSFALFTFGGVEAGSGVEVSGARWPSINDVIGDKPQMLPMQMHELGFFALRVKRGSWDKQATWKYRKR